MMLSRTRAALLTFSPSPPSFRVPPPVVQRFYSPEVWRGVGRAVLFGLLESISANPWTRVPRSEWRSVDALKKHIRTSVLPEAMVSR
jgi:hypothetical protein